MTGDSVEPRAFRDALGRFATGVTVITATDADGRPVGVTVSSLASLSLSPPLVLFCLGRQSTNLAAYAEGPAFVVNVLTDMQRAVSEVFASQRADKFDAVAHETGIDGCPVLHDCLVTLQCRRTIVYDGGDHLIIVGEVKRIAIGQGSPLLYFRSRYAHLGQIF